MIPLVITHDVGGLVLERVIEVEHLRQSGRAVVLDGLCASACTLYLSLPEDQVCATERAVLGFHAASGSDGTPKTGDAGTRVLWSYYPKPFQEWLYIHGGLTDRIIYMGSNEVRKLVQPCRGSNVSASN